MIRVLEVNVDDNGYGGVYSFVLNVIKNISSDFTIDLCAFEKFDSEKNITEIESYGGKVHYCGYKGNVLKKQLHCMVNLKNLVQKEKYDVIHIHSDVSYKLLLYSLFCKSGGAKKILIHSHATGVDGRHRRIKRFLQAVSKPFVGIFADYFLACSIPAGQWMYPAGMLKSKKFTVINNGIDVSKFTYNPDIREKIRQELDLGNSFVVGHVGRFAYQKNHKLLIDIFNEICKIHPDSKLLLIGSYAGDDFYWNASKKQVHELGLGDKVLFLGIRKDVPDLMQAMDCFVLTSHSEGLGIVSIEAQAAGLPIFQADSVPPETYITDLAHKISLAETPSIWASEVVGCIGHKRVKEYENITQAGFNVKREILKLRRLYKT